MDRFWLKNYPPGVPAEIDPSVYPRPAEIDPSVYPSVVDLIEESFAKYGVNHKLNVALLIGGVAFGDQEAKIMRGADVLIHEGQYTPEELPRFRGWGHSSWAQAVEVAERAIGFDVVALHAAQRIGDAPAGAGDPRENVLGEALPAVAHADHDFRAVVEGGDEARNEVGIVLTVGVHRDDDVVSRDRGSEVPQAEHDGSLVAEVERWREDLGVVQSAKVIHLVVHARRVVDHQR